MLRLHSIFVALFWVFIWVLANGAAKPAAAQIVINEIHATPQGSEPEWIELWNTAATTALLDSVVVRDFVASSPLIARLSLPPNSYAVLTRDTTALLRTRTIPRSAVLVQVRLPELNNTTDAVVLLARGRVLDSVWYDMRWGTLGISLERRNPILPARSQEHWSASEDAQGASAGRLNSVTQLRRDARVQSLTFADAAVRVVARNVGREALEQLAVKLYNDANNNRRAEPSEEEASEMIQALVPNESRLVRFPLSSLKTQFLRGTIPMIAVVSAANDERSGNDTLLATVTLTPPRGTVLFNEILYEPVSTPQGQNAEWIEFYNADTAALVLNNWFVVDAARDTARFRSNRTSFVIPPQSYAVVAFDSAFFRQFPSFKALPNVFCTSGRSFKLNNAGDHLVLYDPNSNIMDSLEYSPKWHTQGFSSSSASRGRSLEKRLPTMPSADATAWTTCGDPAESTPLRINSAARPTQANGVVEVTPNPFLRSRSERCELRYVLPFREATLHVQCYDAQGVLQSTIANALFSAAEGVLLWDGRGNSGHTLPSGAYILVVEAFERGGVGSAQTFQRKVFMVLGD